VYENLTECALQVRLLNDFVQMLIKYIERS